jgi:hypothetical protein
MSNRVVMILSTVLFSLMSMPAFSSERHIGSWWVLDEKDPITDQSHVLASLRKPDDGAWFRIGCERGKPNVAIGVRYRYRDTDRVAVALRIDNDVALISEWAPQVESGIAWSGISQSTYQRLLTAKTIAAQLFLQGKGTTVLMFPALETEDALRTLVQACPIDSAAEQRGSKPFDPNAPIFNANGQIGPKKESAPKN